MRLALAAHDPQRTLERGYALVEDAAGRAGHERREAARGQARLTLRLADGTLAGATASGDRRDGDPSDAAPSLSVPPMTETTLTYETACARIEEIIRRLDSGEAGLRETLELCQEGRRLVEFCAAELEAVGRGLEELELDELVAPARGRPRAPA